MRCIHLFLLLTSLFTLLACGGAGTANPASTAPTDGITQVPGATGITGWTDLTALLVSSSGDYKLSLGDPDAEFNNTRDLGSKIVFFDTVSGDNTSAEVYWWNGTHIIDSSGSIADGNGVEYGTNPLKPNENAIKTFTDMSNASLDDRLETQQYNKKEWTVEGLAGGYPDWFLFKRGQTHSEFNINLFGGRSVTEPMVVAAYGTESDGRAVFDVGASFNPFSSHNYDRESNWIHTHIFSIELRRMGLSLLGTSKADTLNGSGGPITLMLEDCKIFNVDGNALSYLPKQTTVYRSVITHGWNSASHNQGYYTSGSEAQVTFEDTIFYKNGYKENPLINADPKRDIFSRNIYQGGGAKMGHTYRGIISADGASGGPQMRLGGLMENSLILEGYFYSSTKANSDVNEWIESEGQVGQSARVKNNVHYIFKSDTANDPGNPDSSSAAQPGWGYSLKGASFGAEVEGNIISAAMLIDDLGDSGDASYGVTLNSTPYVLSAGGSYSQKDNTINNNIFYRTRYGIKTSGDITEVENVSFENNISVNFDDPVVNGSSSLVSSGQVSVKDNTFYSPAPVISEPWIGTNSYVSASDIADAIAKAKAAENWTDPDRTLKEYVTSVLKLSLLDWSDDSNIPQSQKDSRIAAGEAYDPTGIKTFMAVASNMRYGGKDSPPTSAKPDLNGDYEWDDRYTAVAVVNWVREGFGLPALDN